MKNSVKTELLYNCTQNGQQAIRDIGRDGGKSDDWGTVLAGNENYIGNGVILVSDVTGFIAKHFIAAMKDLEIVKIWVSTYIPEFRKNVLFIVFLYNAKLFNQKPNCIG